MSRKAFTIAQDIPWAITEAGLRQILMIANRENLDVEAVEAQLGRKLANTQSITERDGVAVLPITGPLARHANLFTTISGATSIELLARDFNAALNNSSVRAILLSIDSPGGEVNGTDEFAGMVYAARGVKPVYAYVGGSGCSAAYWIASACEQVICAPTAMLGSIGVIAAVPDPSIDSAGDIEFVSSQSPRKNPDPRSDEGKSSIQATIDSLAQVFVETVARNRGVSVDQVLESFGQGGVFVGAEAVAAGLADRTGSYEAVLAQLAGRQPSTQSVRADAPPILGGRQMTLTLPPLLPSAILASGGARVHTSTPSKELTHMSEELQDNRPAAESVQAPPTLPPLPPISDAAMQVQINAYVAQMETRYQAQQDAAFQRAQLQFEQRIAEMQAQQAIQQYAQHITTPTMQRQKTLPLEASAVVTFLSSLNATQRTSAQGLFDRILDSGLVDFSELGSSAETPERSAADAFNEAVSAYQTAHPGTSKTAAIQAVAKADKALYTAYREGK